MINNKLKRGYPFETASFFIFIKTEYENKEHHFPGKSLENGWFHATGFLRNHPREAKQTENLKKVFHDAMKYYKPKN